MIDHLPNELRVRLLHPDAEPPARSRPGDAGYDLKAVEDFVLEPNGRATVRTGLAVALPDGIAGLVTPRSGLAATSGVAPLNAPGLVDPNYRGEVCVVLHNASAERYDGHAGDRIAQLLLVPYWAPLVTVSDELLPPTDDRGEAGFGSSGR